MSHYPPIRYGQAPSSTSNSTKARRNAQIDAFFAHFPNARQLKPDRSLLHLPIQLRNGQIIGVNIQIPARFPEEAPVAFVTQNVSHYFVDQRTKRVNHPYFDTWNINSSSLIEAAKNVEDVLVGGDSSSSSSSNRASVSLLHNNTASNWPQTQTPQETFNSNNVTSSSKLSSVVNVQQQQRIYSEQPIVPGSIRDTINDKLKQLTPEEVAKCLVKEDIYKAFIYSVANDLTVVKKSVEDRFKVLAVAEEIVEKENILTEIKNQIAIIEGSEYADAYRVFEAHKQEYDEMQNKVNINQLLEKLSISSKELEDESKEISNNFLAKSCSTEDFIEDYLEKRKNYYIKKFKCENIPITQ